MGKGNMFQSVGAGRLVDRVVNEVEGLIIGGQLVPDAKLPPEREFAEQLGVSRTVVREAVRILVTKGLLETKHGVGTTVREISTDQVVEPLGLLLAAHDISIDDLHQVRSVLEIEIAGLAALHATEEDVERLEHIALQMEAVKDEPQAFVAADLELHQTLAKMSRNPLIVVLLDSITPLMQEVRLLVHRHPRLHETVMPDHLRIIERIAAKDDAGARRVMQEHLEHARGIQQEVLVLTQPGSGERP
jgi:GntR family transcriptional repressor for pyruvate dehydrogenase complex